ncbi:FG-GAP repeat domain-containing protein [Amycolatopsis pretoriensis]|uniref:Repeat domain-containing protein n=1 Tax=Amycolatopsis pretoriensis TaxID=218821 RepID=A0A1H5RGN5_9PSEU|nr:VCBS repeat-containing protein [Amycolatopsis pretoriensis]SEF37522.1 hypothetical protein SAMN05421837_11482 [Amycolatopsis pretoriensis]
MYRKGIVRTITLTGLAAALGLVGAAPALAAPAGEPIFTSADLNGDGTRDTVISRPAINGKQVISATVNGKRTAIVLPADPWFGIVAPRVADLDADGRAELLVATTLGANTAFFAVLDFDGRNLTQVVGADNKPFEVAEGGGIAAHVGYMCMAPGGNRLFVTVVSSADDISAPAGEITYTGTRTIYSLRAGALTVLEQDAITSRPLADPVTMVDAASCV